MGTLTPTIRNGKLHTVFRPAVQLLNALNNMTRFYTKILNKAHLGKTSAELVALWNQEHPEDPVQD